MRLPRYLTGIEISLSLSECVSFPLCLMLGLSPNSQYSTGEIHCRRRASIEPHGTRRRVRQNRRARQHALDHRIRARTRDLLDCTCRSLRCRFHAAPIAKQPTDQSPLALSTCLWTEQGCWEFVSHSDMVGFLYYFFGLQKAKSFDSISQELSRHIKVLDWHDGVCLPWGMVFVWARKPLRAH